ncbi:MAG: aminotransferase class I/II-fold pyridoxal phosphate-dependent enzyme, partial [Actinomycetota bacterium]|nr:aminotransferase class I/II-fold pyridoxal phosphate-dependent enzyme [Actinomycetota bacterium]
VDDLAERCAAHGALLVLDEAHAALDRWGAGAGAARLVAGSRPVHGELEAGLAAWKGEAAALLFPTGYAANLGVLTTFGRDGARILSDERNHASIVDGCRLARAEVCVYRHGDVGQVDDLLRSSPGRAIVVTDTVFSMDGDAAPVDDLAERCAAHGALLVLDEAHAVLGPDPDLSGVDHLRVGTLSKYLGSLGGFVAGPQAFVDLLVNRARTFVFTTASSPADAAAGLAALRVLCSGEGGALVARLRANVDLVASSEPVTLDRALRGSASPVRRAGPGHPSPIVPVVLGDEDAAMRASAALRDRGLLVPAIRPPTVAPGTSRLRISLSAAHTAEQLAMLLEALGRAS